MSGPAIHFSRRNLRPGRGCGHLEAAGGEEVRIRWLVAGQRQEVWALLSLPLDLDKTFPLFLMREPKASYKCCHCLSPQVGYV